MKAPDVFRYEDVPSFFADFVALNKQRSARFSHEFFARRLRWPRSLLGDLAAGRKALSLSRALEFARHFKLGILATERLIFLSVPRGKARESALDLLRGGERAELEIKRTVQTEVVHNVHRLAVYSLLQHRRRDLSPREIAESLLAIDGLSEECAGAVRSWLFERGYVRADAEGRLTFPKGGLFLDEFDLGGLQVHADFAKSLQNYCRFRPRGFLRGRSTVNSMFVRVPLADFEEFRKRILEFRNWIYAAEADEKQDRDVLLCQFDVNLFPVLNDPALSGGS